MRFLFLGAGAIGTYVGGSLALAGEPVSYVEQAGPLETLRREGLCLGIAGRQRRIHPVQVFPESLQAIRETAPDLIVFALKSYDTAGALESLRAAGSGLPPALCLQNGVENEAALEEVFGKGNVIPGTVTSAVGRGRTGEIVLERKRGIGVALGHPLSRSVADAFDRAGLTARTYADAASMKWSKLLTNLLANASAAILGMIPAEVFHDPRLFQLEICMLRECLRTMRAQNLHPVDLPGTPVRLLALAVERLPRHLSQPVLARAVGGGRGGKPPSLLLDLQSGRGKSEVDWLNGAVARAGTRLGIETPVNRFLSETLQRLAAGRVSREIFRGNPDKFLEEYALSSNKRRPPQVVD
jgi:2-dehydropantoate 2-reductase